VVSTQVAAVPGIPAYDQHVMQPKRHRYCIAIFVIPVLFVVVERLAHRRPGSHVSPMTTPLPAHGEP